MKVALCADDLDTATGIERSCLDLGRSPLMAARIAESADDLCKWPLTEAYNLSSVAPLHLLDRVVFSRRASRF